MNNLQIAKVVHEAIGALDVSAGTKAEHKPWEQLTEEERSQAASNVGNAAHNYYQGAAPSATSDGISTDDPQLKDGITRGIVEAFCKREQELAQGADKQEEQSHDSIDSAMGKADADIAEHNESGVKS
jgi:hypothetical protein